MKKAVKSILLVLLVTIMPACQSLSAQSPGQSVPRWASRAVFYQIFPERFRNGDPGNDPTRASLEYVQFVPQSWRVSRWTSDWYARDAWEQEAGDDFYDHGVFHRRYGGDLQGVIDKLDYLADLGVNALYFNPVFYARSMHKYDGNTFHHIDPYFGPDVAGDLAIMQTETSDPATWKWTAADKLFLALIKQAHAKGLRIIIDGVFNHTGRDFFAFADLQQRQQRSPYQDWYIVNRFDDPSTPQSEFKYEGWWGVESLPVFADTEDGSDLHPGPKKYVFDATRRWMDPDADGNPADGIDGWRLDVASEVPIGFWTDWNRYVRTINPQAYTVAELWGEAAETLVKGRFSATMNYHGFAFPVKGYLIDGKTPPSQFAHDLQTRLTEMPGVMRPALQNLLDSHDTERVASMIVNANRESEYRQVEKYDYDVGETASPRYFPRYQVRKPNERERRIQRMVTLFQFLYVGAPMVYYGTEAGMWGADDPCDRKPMIWEDLQYDAEASHPLGKSRPVDPVQFDRELFEYFQRLIQFRRTHPALHGDSFEVLHTSDQDQTFAFARRGKDETIVGAFNRSAGSKSIVIPQEKVGLESASIGEVVASSKIQAQLKSGAIDIQLPAETGAALLFIKQSTPRGGGGD